MRARAGANCSNGEPAELLVEDLNTSSLIEARDPRGSGPAESIGRRRPVACRRCGAKERIHTRDTVATVENGPQLHDIRQAPITVVGEATARARDDRKLIDCTPGRMLGTVVELRQEIRKGIPIRGPTRIRPLVTVVHIMRVGAASRLAVPRFKMRAVIRPRLPLPQQSSIVVGHRDPIGTSLETSPIRARIYYRLQGIETRFNFPNPIAILRSTRSDLVKGHGAGRQRQSTKKPSYRDGLAKKESETKVDIPPYQRLSLLVS